jgi:hypothetical protein
MSEAGRWLQLGHDILQGGDPVDLFLARIGLATALALQGRVDRARPYIDEVLAPLPSTTSERLLQIGEDWSGSLRPCGGATSIIWSARCTDSPPEPWTAWVGTPGAPRRRRRLRGVVRPRAGRGIDQSGEVGATVRQDSRQPDGPLAGVWTAGGRRHDRGEAR